MQTIVENCSTRVACVNSMRNTEGEFSDNEPTEAALYKPRLACEYSLQSCSLLRILSMRKNQPQKVYGEFINSCI